MTRRAGPAEPEPNWLTELIALPWRSYELDTHLTRHQVEEAIEKISEQPRPFRWPHGKRSGKFAGDVSRTGFKLARIIFYRTPFRPVVIGQFDELPTGTRVAIFMSLKWLGLVSWLAWMTLVIGLILFAEFSTSVHHPDMLLLCAVPLFGYLICSVLFGLEARWARELLTETLTRSSY
ncbi:MAG TPA: hypothetical protein VJX23_15440 [Candidatus Binataceae bacterium]|nr:hypothetical protein [Candidatus Binataceae bacterium]